MYKELLARLKEQRESLDQSIVMLEEHIRYNEKAVISAPSFEWDQKRLEALAKADSHDKEIVKGLAPGMGEPISITGDPLQHKFMHLAKGVLETTNKHLPKEQQIVYPNPTGDPLAHLYADGKTLQPKEIETSHSISKPMDLDHLVNKEPKDNIHVVIQILNVDTAEVQETHVYVTHSDNKNFAIGLAKDRQAALHYLIKEKYPKRNLETTRRYTYSLHSDNFPKETGDLFIYEANGGKN
jgi:hypothetical protein